MANRQRRTKPNKRATSSILSTYARQSFFHKAGILAFILLFAGIGAYLLLSSRAATPIKPLLTGVIDRKGFDQIPAEYRSIVNGFVINANWSALQETEDGPIKSNNVIDQGIMDARAHNMRVRIRIFGGSAAPQWLKNKVGTFAATNENDGLLAQVPKFWAPAYSVAYADLQAKLAARYDTVPEIADVAPGSCMTFFAETFLRGASGADLGVWQNAGYTEAADKECHRRQLEAHKAWVRTRTAYSINPLQVMTIPARTEFTFTKAMVSKCRTDLGRRCIVGHNSLGPNESSRLQTYIAGLAPPKYFQTETMERIHTDSLESPAGHLVGALDTGIQAGARSIELPSGYQDSAEIPKATLADRDQQLQSVL